MSKEIDSILATAKKDTGYTKSGGFKIPLETIEAITKAVEKEDIALPIEAFGNLIGKTKNKEGTFGRTPLNNLVNAFNSVIARDYDKTPLKASSRKNTKYTDEKGKEQTGMIAIVKTDRS